MVTERNEADFVPIHSPWGKMLAPCASGDVGACFCLSLLRKIDKSLTSVFPDCTILTKGVGCVFRSYPLAFSF